MIPDARSIWDLLLAQIQRRADHPCLSFCEHGRWQEWTWIQLATQAVHWSEHLLNAGLTPGQRVVLWSENRWEWIVADLAIQATGAISVPLHASLAPQQVGALIEHCEPEMLLVSRPSQLAALGQVSPRYVKHRRCIAFDAESQFDRGLVAPFPQRSSLMQPDELVRWLGRSPVGRGNPAVPMTILYTSGTTGRPKGVMLSQRNVLANVESKLAALPLTPSDLRLCFLPLSHIFARACDVFTWLAAGCHLALARSPAEVFEDLLVVRPTYLNGVPYFFEKCLRVAQQLSESDTPGYLNHLLGGRVRLCNCGGAPLPDPVQRWFDEQGVTLVTGYGMTEASPVITSSSPGRMKIGAVGRAVPGVEVKLAVDGEVLVRGENVMLGYYRDPAATAEAIAAGWLATGDIGSLDTDGYLTLKGRKKELIITSGGKKIDPQQLERRILVDSQIEQCIVVGDQRDYLIALIFPSRLATHASNDAEGWLCRVNDRLADVGRYEQMGRVIVIDEPFSVANGCLTLKGSLRRSAIQCLYRDAIRDAYAVSERAR